MRAAANPESEACIPPPPSPRPTRPSCTTSCGGTASPSLTTHGAGGLVASHLPLLLDADAGPQGAPARAHGPGQPAVAAVEGEVAGRLLRAARLRLTRLVRGGGDVPTWNYVAVHAYGTFELVDDRDGLLDILRRSVAAYESPRPEPWPFDESAPHVEGLLKSIVGFRIEITRLEGKWKLSQNHPEGRRRKVIRSLAARPDADSQAISGLMLERPMGGL